jgi:hypothetical protein
MKDLYLMIVKTVTDYLRLASSTVYHLIELRTIARVQGRYWMATRRLG